MWSVARLLVILISVPAFGQALSYTPPASAAYIKSGGNWIPASAGSSGALSYTPPAIALYCSSDSGVTWTPCAFTSGTVTSVAITVPAPLTATGCSGSSSVSCAITWTTGQTQNQVLATPNGSSGPVGLRALVAADIPSLAATYCVISNPCSLASATVTGGAAGYTFVDRTGGQNWQWYGTGGEAYLYSGYANVFGVTVAGGIQFLASTYANCTALTTSSNTVGCTASDARLKTRVSTLSPAIALAFARGIDEKFYSFKDAHGAFSDDRVHIGLMAQDVQKYPEIASAMVTQMTPTHDTPGATLAVDYQQAGVIALAAIKELEKQHESDARRIRTLELKIKKIQANQTPVQ